MAKRKIEAAQIEDLITIETKELEVTTTSKGRPKKFNKKLNTPVNIYLSAGQLAAIDEKIKEIGFSVRQDYFRKLLRADIPDFDEL
ncbi:hypothetical protein [Arcobacter porcinus]|uniref:Uncharacterized protein n=1 Tax=Arcobacter porcinus TaxID=1935204 RepID=A0A5C2HKV5_9BACT|nr:hypothetical protein [Arcobacter porcinus]OCL85316.1 hypothetical protein AAX27_02154 [Aliarcobacter thereius]OCL81823.1 hypothetical protein AAW29_01798 [Arcobacter porcinus]OCL82325.1 hypothetical protein AAW30_01612 [Arcobacter porcinus]OCL86280.1 hypothetical protein AAX30_01624 [Arcobacter porcinus]QEP40898.1 hypothetical protein APORC_1304 [Arcobacter porcinus]